MTERDCPEGERGHSGAWPGGAAGLVLPFILLWAVWRPIFPGGEGVPRAEAIQILCTLAQMMAAVASAGGVMMAFAAECEGRAAEAYGRACARRDELRQGVSERTGRLQANGKLEWLSKPLANPINIEESVRRTCVYFNIEQRVIMPTGTADGAQKLKSLAKRVGSGAEYHDWRVKWRQQRGIVEGVVTEREVAQWCLELLDALRLSEFADRKHWEMCMLRRAAATVWGPGVGLILFSCIQTTLMLCGDPLLSGILGREWRDASGSQLVPAGVISSVVSVCVVICAVGVGWTARQAMSVREVVTVTDEG